MRVVVVVIVVSVVVDTFCILSYVNSNCVLCELQKEV